MNGFSLRQKTVDGIAGIGFGPAEHLPPGTRLKAFPGPFRLESGTELEGVRAAYHTWGTLDPDGGNCVLVCHALTGSSSVRSWWPAMVGPGRVLDTDRDFVVCVNVLGSCYGTTGPASLHPRRRGVWGPEFPEITIRDMVRLQAWLLSELGVRRLRQVIGGSLGGMQVLEWGALYPRMVEALVPVAVSGRHSAWCIGLSEAQRRAIAADPLWKEGRYPPHRQPSTGLAAARMMAMCTYRSRESFQDRFGRRLQGPERYQVESYLHHHGDKLVDRFDANTYMTLTRAMDTHDLGRDRRSFPAALRAMEMPALVVAITTDVLYPPSEQEELVRHLPNGELALIESSHGHDAFLIETAQLSAQVRSFRQGLEEQGKGGAA